MTLVTKAALSALAGLAVAILVAIGMGRDFADEHGLVSHGWMLPVLAMALVTTILVFSFIKKS